MKVTVKDLHALSNALNIAVICGDMDETSKSAAELALMHVREDRKELSKHEQHAESRARRASRGN